MDEELLGTTAEAVVVLDTDLSVRAASDAALALLEYMRAELLGRSAASLVAFGAEWVAQEHRVLLQQGSWYGDVAIRTKRGAVRHIVADATLVPHPDGVRIVLKLLPR